MSAICKWPRAVSRCLPSWSPLLPRSSDPAAALAWGPAPPQRSAAQRSVSGRRGPRARSQRPAAGFPEQKPAGSRDGPQDGEGHHRPRVRQEPVGLGPRHPQPQGGRGLSDLRSLRLLPPPVAMAPLRFRTLDTNFTSSTSSWFKLPLVESSSGPGRGRGRRKS
nr:uncharacterized protein LOC120367887 isoform X3 [Saimiri boliviensis boliviensis]